MTDLIKSNKFPNLYDSELHVIIGIREAEIINFEKTRKPLNCDEPFASKCKIGWTAFGPDPYLKNKPINHINFVRISETFCNNNSNPNCNHNPDYVLRTDQFYTNTCDLETEIPEDVWIDCESKIDSVY